MGGLRKGGERAIYKRSMYMTSGTPVMSEVTGDDAVKTYSM